MASSNSISLPGLSGYDFSGIIDKMTQVYKLPENQMNDKKSLLTSKKDAWLEVNTRLKAMNDALTKLRSASTWTAAKTTSSNTAMLNATAGPDSVQGAYSIKVINLAQAQTVVSAIQIVADEKTATAVTTGSFNITVGDQTATVNVTAGDSLTKIATSINNAKAGVTSSVIKVDGGYRLAIAANQTGEVNAATFSNVNTGAVLQDLGLADGGNSLNLSQAAADAKLVINGIQDITSASNSVTTVIPGVTLNLNAADNGASTVNLTISSDNSIAQDAVQGFITQYNNAMDYIAGQLEFNSDTKKAGALNGDSNLRGIQARLRNMVTGDLNNPTSPYNTLSMVGIKTSSTNYGLSADLSLDADKFTKALADNWQSVANLFGAPADDTEPLEDSDPTIAQGLANRLGAYLDPLVKFSGSLDQKQQSLDAQIKDIDQRIVDFERRADVYQEMLKARFSAMETLLSQLSDQGSWLTQQTNMMTKSGK